MLPSYLGTVIRCAPLMFGDALSFYTALNTRIFGVLEIIVYFLLAEYNSLMCQSTVKGILLGLSKTRQSDRCLSLLVLSKALVLFSLYISQFKSSVSCLSCVWINCASLTETKITWK